MKPIPTKFDLSLIKEIIAQNPRLSAIDLQAKIAAPEIDHAGGAASLAEEANPALLLIEGEQLVLDLRPHWIALVMPVLGVSAILVVQYLLYQLNDSWFDDSGFVNMMIGILAVVAGSWSSLAGAATPESPAPSSATASEQFIPWP